MPAEPNWINDQTYDTSTLKYVQYEQNFEKAFTITNG